MAHQKLTKQLMPWGRVLLEPLIALQLVRKMWEFLEPGCSWKSWQRPAICIYPEPDATSPQHPVLFLEDTADCAWWEVAILLYQSQFSPCHNSFAVQPTSLNRQAGIRPVRNFKCCLKSKSYKIIFYAEFSFTVFFVVKNRDKNCCWIWKCWEIAVFNFLSFPRAFDINRCYFAEKCDVETVPKDANFTLIINLSGANESFILLSTKSFP